LLFDVCFASMKQQESHSHQGNMLEQRPFKVLLAGFLVENEVGLGDVIKRATAAVGIRPCEVVKQYETL